MISRTLAAAAALLVCFVVAQDARAANEKKPAKVTVRKHGWKGYGFLPGYPRTERERQRDRMFAERRYIDGFGRVHYGFGGPGFYRGQYNGGSFGPCWTSTPIGLMWNCGR